MSSTDGPERTYRGNCHCGAFVFEARLPEVRAVHECNCSLCRRKGYLFVFAAEAGDGFRVVRGAEEALTSYTFGAGEMFHKFCPTCASPVMALFPAGPPGKRRALNVHTFQGVNTWTLERKPVDGASHGAAYVPHQYKGPLPADEAGKKLYTGSCHCGRVGVALNSEPLDETFDGRFLECNCSICERNGYLWIYPARGSVELSGDEAAIGRYAFSRSAMAKTFCRTCGVCLTNDFDRACVPDVRGSFGLTPEQEREFARFAETFRPVNLRVLHGVDPAVMRAPERFDGATGLLPRYQDP
ncbi:hypothetical protein CDD83_10976 [Cordyceps sp. RAO-2017]|nr:hypothetical protein CDD83_10976 [Cordyceps sp. RAO-2017]